MPACRPRLRPPRRSISAGSPGASGAAQRRAFAAAFPASPRGGCRATATPPFSACSAPARRTAFDRHGCRRLPARSPGGGPRSCSGWGFPVADRGSGAWLGFRLAAEYLDHLDGCRDHRRQQLSGRRGGSRARAAIARRSCRGWPPRAPPISPPWRPAWSRLRRRRSAGQALLDRGRARTSAPRPGARADARRPRSASAAGLPRSTAPASRRRSPVPCCRPSRRPDPIRGAWLVATGQVPPANIPTSTDP